MYIYVYMYEVFLKNNIRSTYYQRIVTGDNSGAATHRQLTKHNKAERTHSLQQLLGDFSCWARHDDV